MKIIYLHQYFNSPKMAGSTRSYEMARRLVSRGHEVHIVTSWRELTDKSDWFEEVIDGIHVHFLPVEYSNHMGYLRRIRAFFLFAFKAGRRAISIGGDVVFATSTPLTIAIPGIYSSAKLKVPMIFEVRDLWPELPIAIGVLSNPIAQYMARLLESVAYRRSAHIIALSEGMAEGVASKGYPREQITVIPNGSDLGLFQKIDGRDIFRQKIPNLGDKVLITYTGTLGVINGVGYFVEIAAAALLEAPELRFAVVGGGAEDLFVRRKADELGVLNRTFFMFPSVPKVNMPDVLAGTDVAISLFVNIKAMWANSANKFFDALAAGKPIAINYGGWQAEILKGTGAGIRLPENNPTVAAKMLADWTSDRDSLKKSGGAARQLAENQYDRNKLASDLEYVMQNVINGEI